MSLTFGPSYLDTPIKSANQVTITTWDGALVTLASPVELQSNNFITFTVAEGGRYLIRVQTRELQKDYNVKLSEDNYDPTDPRQYVDAQIAFLQSQIDSGTGGGGDGVPTSRAITAGTGLTGGGDLTADRSLALNAASQTSLGKADTAVQPTRSITTGTGLTGGGTLAANRSIALNTASIASLAKADSAVQPADLTTKADITYVDDEINAITPETLTQTQYDALTPTPGKVYYIVEA